MRGLRLLLRAPWILLYKSLLILWFLRFILLIPAAILSWSWSWLPALMMALFVLAILYSGHFLGRLIFDPPSLPNCSPWVNSQFSWISSILLSWSNSLPSWIGNHLSWISHLHSLEIKCPSWIDYLSSMINDISAITADKKRDMILGLLGLTSLSFASVAKYFPEALKALWNIFIYMFRYVYLTKLSRIPSPIFYFASLFHKRPQTFYPSKDWAQKWRKVWFQSTPPIFTLSFIITMLVSYTLPDSIPDNTDIEFFYLLPQQPESVEPSDTYLLASPVMIFPLGVLSTEGETFDGALNEVERRHFEEGYRIDSDDSSNRSDKIKKLIERLGKCEKIEIFGFSSDDKFADNESHSDVLNLGLANLRSETVHNIFKERGVKADRNEWDDPDKMRNKREEIFEDMQIAFSPRIDYRSVVIKVEDCEGIENIPIAFPFGSIKKNENPPQP